MHAEHRQNAGTTAPQAVPSRASQPYRPWSLLRRRVGAACPASAAAGGCMAHCADRGAACLAPDLAATPPRPCIHHPEHITIPTFTPPRAPQRGQRGAERRDVRARERGAAAQVDRADGRAAARPRGGPRGQRRPDGREVVAVAQRGRRARQQHRARAAVRGHHPAQRPGRQACRGMAGRSHRGGARGAGACAGGKPLAEPDQAAGSVAGDVRPDLRPLDPTMAQATGLLGAAAGCSLVFCAPPGVAQGGYTMRTQDGTRLRRPTALSRAAHGVGTLASPRPGAHRAARRASAWRRAARARARQNRGWRARSAPGPTWTAAPTPCAGSPAAAGSSSRGLRGGRGSPSAHGMPATSRAQAEGLLRGPGGTVSSCR